jgi:hypothetical protein
MEEGYVPPIYRVMRWEHDLWKDYKSWKYQGRALSRLFDDR